MSTAPVTSWGKPSSPHLPRRWPCSSVPSRGSSASSSSWSSAGSSPRCWRPSSPNCCGPFASTISRIVPGLTQFVHSMGVTTDARRPDRRHHQMVRQADRARRRLRRARAAGRLAGAPAAPALAPEPRRRPRHPGAGRPRGQRCRLAGAGRNVGSRLQQLQPALDGCQGRHLGVCHRRGGQPAWHRDHPGEHPVHGPGGRVGPGVRAGLRSRWTRHCRSDRLELVRAEWRHDPPSGSGRGCRVVGVARPRRWQRHGQAASVHTCVGAGHGRPADARRFGTSGPPGAAPPPHRAVRTRPRATAGSPGDAASPREDYGRPLRGTQND